MKNIHRLSRLIDNIEPFIVCAKVLPRRKTQWDFVVNGKLITIINEDTSDTDYWDVYLSGELVDSYIFHRGEDDDIIGELTVKSARALHRFNQSQRHVDNEFRNGFINGLSR